MLYRRFHQQLTITTSSILVSTILEIEYLLAYFINETVRL